MKIDKYTYMITDDITKELAYQYASDEGGKTYCFGLSYFLQKYINKFISSIYEEFIFKMARFFVELDPTGKMLDSYKQADIIFLLLN